MPFGAIWAGSNIDKLQQTHNLPCLTSISGEMVNYITIPTIAYKKSLWIVRIVGIVPNARICQSTSPDGKVKSGYAIKSTDRLDLFAEFMNYRTESARINIAFDFEYIPGKPEGYLNSQSIMFSATPCSHTGFNVPG
jgi:hypothetical protein